MHGLEAEYWGSVDFIYLDREDPANADIVSSYGVAYQPVFILIAPDGTEVQRWFGGTVDEFRLILDGYLAAGG